VKRLRPLFHRSASGDAPEREAERLKNRDWVEILRVVHPTQARAAENEYMLARLRSDWSQLTSPLLATHSLPVKLDNGYLLVLCDHNTFANELSLLAGAVEKKIAAEYGYTLKIGARASRRIEWPRSTEAPPAAPETAKSQRQNPVLETLIREIGKL
jgi:hypothetical protein